LRKSPSSRKRFDAAKTKTQEAVRYAYAPAHEAAMAQPLEEALREGGVLAEVPASP
jgi:hypothetical protein